MFTHIYFLVKLLEVNTAEPLITMLKRAYLLIYDKVSYKKLSSRGEAVGYCPGSVEMTRFTYVHATYRNSVTSGENREKRDENKS